MKFEAFVIILGRLFEYIYFRLLLTAENNDDL